LTFDANWYDINSLLRINDLRSDPASIVFTAIPPIEKMNYIHC
jgi:hypothetical protein